MDKQLYKILIVDDEEIEREGMAGLIEWEQYGMILVGTAWNGIEGLEKIRTLSPDIVLTDIKMPGMDGIELIQNTREQMPWVEFVVLSGYGEYEYTSKAMEQGIRYYLMKPCDERQILEVLDKVIAQIIQKRSRKEQEESYRSTVARLLPKAREQLFRDMIYGETFKEQDFRLFAAEHDVKNISVQLLAFFRETGFDYLEQFILQNIINEQIGNTCVLLYAYVQNQMLFMLDERAAQVEESVQMLKRELGKRNPVPIFTAISKAGRIGDIRPLYEQIEELLRIGQAEDRSGLLSYQTFARAESTAKGVVDFRRIRDAQEDMELLRELYFIFVRMRRRNFSLEQQAEMAVWVGKVLYGKTMDISWEDIRKTGENIKDGESGRIGQERELYRQTAFFLAECKGLGHGEGKEQQRVQEMVFATFQYLAYQPLNLRFLAGQVLYRNEEHLSRTFHKVMQCKYSTWLIDERVEMAKRLLQEEPDLKISVLAELVGYAPDGQYFSKVFHKVTGMTPAEYRGGLRQTGCFRDIKE